MRGMKRRAFLNGLLLSPLCDAALAANPVAAMQETPMFDDRVKAGCRYRKPHPRWIRRRYELR